jgi:N-acetylglucosamine malate deacetylase 1
VTKTVLALGAHYDDLPFGLPGTLIKAARRGWRVVILNLIEDYSNFAPARDRSEALRKGCVQISRDYGAEMRFLGLGLRGHHFQATPEIEMAVAEVVAEVRPDVAFTLWPHDRHGDHVVAARISESALRHAGPLLDLAERQDRPVRAPGRIYAYDNGPRHTIGFEPDTYVDVSDVWTEAREWLARSMALAFGWEDGGGHPAVALKETQARYRGATCGVHYAEALRSLNAYPVELF